MLHSARIPAHHTPAILRTHGERGGWSHSKEEGKMAFLLTMKSKIKNKEAPGYHFFFLRLYSGPACSLSNTLCSLKIMFIRINAKLFF